MEITVCIEYLLYLWLDRCASVSTGITVITVNACHVVPVYNVFVFSFIFSSRIRNVVTKIIFCRQGGSTCNLRNKPVK